MARAETPTSKEAAVAVRLALLLDRRHSGLTMEQILRSDALSLDDQDESDETLRKRFERARERLGRVGIVISNVAPAGEEARYVVDAGLSYSAEQSVELNGEQALRLASLLAVCRQANLPLHDDLERARTRLAAMVQVKDATEGSPRDEAPQGTRRNRDAAAAPSPTDPADEPALDAVTEAYAQGHPLAFSYVDAQGAASQRTVDPYGLFKHRGRTYVAGLDEGRGAIRVFRIGRIAARPTPQPDRSRTYAIPADFQIRDYMHLPFQYGSTPFIAAFRDTRTLSEQERTAATQGFGTWEDAGGDAVWHVEGSDLDEAAHWAALALASDGLVPVEPPELVEAVRAGLERTVRLHG